MFNSDNKSIYGAYRNESEYQPESNLRPETQRYIEEMVKPGRAMGELNHPTTADVDLEEGLRRLIEWRKLDKDKSSK